MEVSPGDCGLSIDIRAVANRDDRHLIGDPIDHAKITSPGTVQASKVEMQWFPTRCGLRASEL